MFYLKYRPQKFSELISPNPVADALAKQVATGKTSHAYLFIGPRGTGKTTMARILAKSLNCSSLLENGDPCGKCANCLSIEKGNFPDLIEIDAASNRGIDDIRLLRDRIGLSPSQGSRKVYIIDEVHMLTKEAFNALLKTLEEPPAHVTFVLCTTEPHKVLDTIKSRCQVFNFKRAPVNQITAKLKRIADSEGVKVDSQTLTKIAQASFGGFRDAETLLQQVIEGDLNIDSFAGSMSPADYTDFTEFLACRDAASALAVLESAYEEGMDMLMWSLGILDYLRDLLFLKMGATKNLDLTKELLLRAEDLAAGFSVRELIFISRRFLEARNLIMDSNLPTLPLELAVAEICGGRGDNNALGVSAGKKPKELTNTKRKSAGTGGSKNESNGKGKPGAKGKAVSEDKGKDKGKGKSSNKHTKKGEKEILSSGNSTSGGNSTPKTTQKTPTENSGIDIKLDEITSQWNKVLRTSTKYNHSVRALLKATKVLDLKENVLILEAQFAFHKDRLEYSKNRQIVEQVLLEVFGRPLTISCTVKKISPKQNSSRESGTLTDLNIVAPDFQSSEVSLDGSLLEVFDGGLPAV